MVAHQKSSDRPVGTLALTLLLAWLALAIPGCLERKETLIVHPDGACTVTITFTSDNPDFDQIDLPSASEGWALEKSQKKDDQGRTRHSLTASRDFPAGAELPTCDGPADSLKRAESLHFRTTLRVDRQPDATYYRFQRVYEARPWAWWNPVEDEQKNKEMQKEMEEKKDKMTAEDWERIILASRRMQTHRKLIVARRAFVESSPRASQDIWLRAEQSVSDDGRSFDPAELVKLMQSPQSKERDERLGSILSDMEKQTDADIEKALVDGGYDPKSLAEFKARLEKINRYNAATGTLRSTPMAVEVRMPGSWVGANTRDQIEGSAKWVLSGEMLRDRSIEMLATSKVPAK